MNFLNIRVVVNGKKIYSLPKNTPVLISVAAKHTKIVATDGFHITKPFELQYPYPATYYVRVVCGIDDNLLYTGIVLMLLFSVVGLISSIQLFKWLSFLPVLYFLFLYYINRKNFIQIRMGH